MRSDFGVARKRCGLGNTSIRSRHATWPGKSQLVRSFFLLHHQEEHCYEAPSSARKGGRENGEAELEREGNLDHMSSKSAWKLSPSSASVSPKGKKFSTIESTPFRSFFFFHPIIFALPAPTSSVVSLCIFLVSPYLNSRSRRID